MWPWPRKMNPPVAPTGVFVLGPHGEDEVGHTLAYAGIHDEHHTYVLHINKTYAAMFANGEASVRVDVMPPRTQIVIQPFPPIEGEL